MFLWHFVAGVQKLFIILHCDTFENDAAEGRMKSGEERKCEKILNGQFTLAKKRIV